MSIRVLFVGKDANTVASLVPCLERHGYQVTVAHSQRQATARSRSLRPDLLILDVVSFGATGDKVSEALRSRLEEVPAILLLASNRIAGHRAAGAVMTPPFTSRKLLYRVRKVMAEAPGQRSHEIQVGPLVLDLDDCLLRKEQESMHLRPKEAALLALFMNNPGRVLSRQEIMKQVWETEYVGDTRTINVHMRWLREKIEEDPGHPRLLRTVRGLGYRFEVPDEQRLPGER